MTTYSIDETKKFFDGLCHHTPTHISSFIKQLLQCPTAGYSIASPCLIEPGDDPLDGHAIAKKIINKSTVAAPDQKTAKANKELAEAKDFFSQLCAANESAAIELMTSLLRNPTGGFSGICTPGLIKSDDIWAYYRGVEDVARKLVLKAAA